MTQKQIECLMELEADLDKLARATHNKKLLEARDLLKDVLDDRD